MKLPEMTDIDVSVLARAVAEYPSNQIDYSEFDRMAGGDYGEESLDKQAWRRGAMNRVNTVLERGLVLDDSVHAYSLRVGQKGDHFRRSSIGDAAIMELARVARKVSSAIDNANRRAAYALGLPAFETVLDRRQVRFRKESPPPLDSSTKMMLSNEYRSSLKRKRLIQVLIEEETESQEWMARILTPKLGHDKKADKAA